MNFKPTKNKMIVMIIAIISDFLFWLYYSKFTYACGLGQDCTGPVNLEMALLSLVVNPFSLLFLFLVYLIWSLIQKKK